MLSASDHRSSSSPSSGSPSPQEPDRPGRKNHRKPRGSGRENHGDRPGRKKPWGSGVRRRKRLRDFAGGGSVVGRSRYPRPPPGGPRSEFKQAMLPHRSPSIVGKGRWVQLDRPRDRRSSSWGGCNLSIGRPRDRLSSIGFYLYMGCSCHRRRPTDASPGSPRLSD